MENKEKVIFLDFGIFSHRAIFAYQKMLEVGANAMPIDYICLNMIASALRRIGVSPFDTIIVACDGRNSWRKSLETTYKGNRKKIDNSFWKPINELVDSLEKGTNWTVIKEEGIEADDIMAVGCRVFKDKEIIIVSYDSDLEQCYHYPNVKIFSILKKGKSGKGAYKIPPENFNVDTFIAKKVQKEVADNLVNTVYNEDDYDKREMVVSLLKLPEFVENICKERLLNLKTESGDLNCIKYKSLREKIGNLYNDKSKIITYDYCLKKELKKKVKKIKRRK